MKKSKDTLKVAELAGKIKYYISLAQRAKRSDACHRNTVKAIVCSMQLTEYLKHRKEEILSKHISAWCENCQAPRQVKSLPNSIWECMTCKSKNVIEIGEW